MFQRGEWTLCITNYQHPTITTGQHTNGPGRVWVLASGIWLNTGSSKLHRVMRELEANGVSRIAVGAWNEYEAAARREER